MRIQKEIENVERVKDKIATMPLTMEDAIEFHKQVVDRIEKERKEINKELGLDDDIEEKGFTGASKEPKKVSTPELKKMKLSESLFKSLKEDRYARSNAFAAVEEGVGSNYDYNSDTNDFYLFKCTKDTAYNIKNRIEELTSFRYGNPELIYKLTFKKDVDDDWDDEDDDYEESLKEELENTDGWGDQIEYRLEEIFSHLENLMYEIRNCRRGVYTGCETAEELADLLHMMANDLDECSQDINADRNNINESLDENPDQEIRKIIQILKDDESEDAYGEAIVDMDNRFERYFGEDNYYNRYDGEPLKAITYYPLKQEEVLLRKLKRIAKKYNIKLDESLNEEVSTKIIDELTTFMDVYGIDDETFLYYLLHYVDDDVIQKVMDELHEYMSESLNEAKREQRDIFDLIMDELMGIGNIKHWKVPYEEIKPGDRYDDEQVGVSPDDEIAVYGETEDELALAKRIADLWEVPYKVVTHENAPEGGKFELRIAAPFNESLTEDVFEDESDKDDFIDYNSHNTEQDIEKQKAEDEKKRKEQERKEQEEMMKKVLADERKAREEEAKLKAQEEQRAKQKAEEERKKQAFSDELWAEKDWVAEEEKAAKEGKTIDDILGEYSDEEKGAIKQRLHDFKNDETKKAQYERRKNRELERKAKEEKAKKEADKKANRERFLKKASSAPQDIVNAVKSGLSQSGIHIR